MSTYLLDRVSKIIPKIKDEFDDISYDTLISLECEKHGNYTKSVHQILYKNSNCPECTRINKNKKLSDIGKTKIGELNNFYGHKHSEETLKKLRKPKSEEIKQKISNTVKSKECQDRTKQTNKEKYGNENYRNVDKIRKTNIKKFGTPTPAQNEEIKNKIRESHKNKSSNQKQETVNKIKETKKQIYGTETYNNREKAEITCIQKYGVKTANQYGSDMFYTTMQQKYGDNWKSVVGKLASEGLHRNMTLFEKENDCTAISKIIHTYGQGWLSMKTDLDLIYNKSNVYVKNSDIAKIIDYNESPHNISGKELQLLEYIKSIYNGKVISNSRNIIKPYELDMYFPDKNIAIEFNGMYWHSALYKAKNYHLDKSKLCQELGIRLIHIYEWELEEPYWSKIKMMLNEAFNNSNKIYARNCSIKEITNKEAKILNEKVHLQGHRNAQVTYGLFYNNELVQLMSFSKTKYNRNIKNDNEWEIIRGCPGSNTSVIGGVSKLLKHFIRTHNPKMIFSYCDFNKFSGTSYETVGMKFDGYTGPDKTWIINGKPIIRNPFRYKEYKEQAETIVCGAGSKKYSMEVI